MNIPNNYQLEVEFSFLDCTLLQNFTLGVLPSHMYEADFSDIMNSPLNYEPTITNGPFRDMLAIFDRPTSSYEWVQVLLHILGQASRVRLAVTDLERASVKAEMPAPPIKRPRRSRGRGRHIKRASWQAG